jgi:hypothetical protein
MNWKLFWIFFVAVISIEVALFWPSPPDKEQRHTTFEQYARKHGVIE